MTTSDPTTPALLSAPRPIGYMGAAEIDALQARCGEYGLPAREACRVLASHAALLAHLDALTAPAPADGGEALGRRLFEHMSEMAWPNGRGKIGGPDWDGLREDSRSYYRTAAAALDAHGYARGVAAGEAQAAEDIAQFEEIAEDLRIVICDRDTEIARLTAERDAMAVELAEARAAVVHADFAGGLSVCSRPGETAKDVDRITCPACLAKLYSVANEDADRMRTEVDRLLAERDTDLLDATEKERTACATFLRSEGLEGAAAEMVGVRARAARRARGEGQGS